MVEEYKINGIIDVILQACHTYNIKTHRIKDAVTKEGGNEHRDQFMGLIRMGIEVFLELL